VPVVEVRFTVQVGHDLTRIGDTIAKDNRAAAAAFIESIRRHCYLLASVPLMGRARPDMGQDIRSFPHGRYIVFYRFRSAIDRVEVLRVWHGRRLPPTRSDLGIE
jgi:toxin ParE1/3/4